MSRTTKTYVKFFTIVDYEAEEIWMREMHQQGWKPYRFILPCFYVVEKCEPADIVYRMVVSENPKKRPDYVYMLRDYGWKYHSSGCMNYYWKPADADERKNELFTDPTSKFNAIRKVIRRQMFIVLFTFFCSVLPGTYNIFYGEAFIYHARAWQITWLCILTLYVCMAIYCIIGFRKQKKKYQNT